MHRAIGITQKSAWFLQQRIRLAVQSGSFEKMSGGVEVDETFIGGKARNMHADKRKRVITKRGMSGKAAVMGLLNRETREVRTAVVDNVKRRTLHPVIQQHVAPGSTIFADAHPAYVGLSPDYVHKVIDHAKAYVKGEVHTNGLENFGSLFKRCIRGLT
jgi:transposase-like protein